MTYIRAEDIKITFNCLDCGPVSLVLSDGRANDSIASCSKCEKEFGRWDQVRVRAHQETVVFERAVIQQALRR